MKKLICKIFGHKWTYGVTRNRKLRRSTFPMIYCKRCGHLAKNQWEIYQKLFLGKPEGKFKKEV